MSTASAWEAYLRQARWFGGKGLAASVTAIEPMPWYTATGQWPAVRSEIARISYADGRIEHYQLLVAYVAPGSAPAGLPVRIRARGTQRAAGSARPCRRRS